MHDQKQCPLDLSATQHDNKNVLSARLRDSQGPQAGGCETLRSIDHRVGLPIDLLRTVNTWVLEQAHAKQQKRQILARQEDAHPGVFAVPRARSTGKKAGSAEVSDKVLAMSLTDAEGCKSVSVRPR